MAQSLSFAAKIQKQFKDNSKRFSRGVKQAGFLVLYKTAMPSVLIENGFLTNDNDQKFLMSDAGQASMASSIYRAFKSYKSELETGIASKDSDEKDSIDSGQLPDSNKEVNSKTNTKTNEVSKGTEPKASDSLEVKNKNQSADIIKDSKKSEEDKAEVNSSVYSKLAFITVQVGAVKDNGPVPEKVKDLKTVFKIKFEDGYTRYFVGQFKTISEGKARLEKLQKAGFSDAFLTAYDHMVKVKCSEIQNKK